MLGFLRSLFRSRAPVPPVVVRARTGSVPPTEVTVDAVWYPSGLRKAYRAKHAQGLCMLPWIPDSDRVAITVRASGATAALEVQVNAAREGRAFDLALV
jgi:hypothetical protein